LSTIKEALTSPDVRTRFESVGAMVRSGTASSPTFGILNALTGTLFVATFEPVSTYRGVSKS